MTCLSVFFFVVAPFNIFIAPSNGRVVLEENHIITAVSEAVVSEAVVPDDGVVPEAVPAPVPESAASVRETTAAPVLEAVPPAVVTHEGHSDENGLEENDQGVMTHEDFAMWKNGSKRPGVCNCPRRYEHNSFGDGERTDGLEDGKITPNGKNETTSCSEREWKKTTHEKLLRPQKGAPNPHSPIVTSSLSGYNNCRDPASFSNSDVIDEDPFSFDPLRFSNSHQKDDPEKREWEKEGESPPKSILVLTTILKTILFIMGFVAVVLFSVSLLVLGIGVGLVIHFTIRAWEQNNYARLFAVRVFPGNA